MNADAVQYAVDVLNRALKTDRGAITNLFIIRVPCNKNLADDPTIQVREQKDETYSVSMLGIINGLFGVDPKTNWGHVAMVVEQNGYIVRFEKLESPAEELSA